MNPGPAVKALFVLGLGGGVIVTFNAHRHPSSPWWDERVGATRLRRSDMPVVGLISLIVASVLRARGHRGPARAIFGLGLGAACGATGTGLLEPLPRRGS